MTRTFSALLAVIAAMMFSYAAIVVSSPYATYGIVANVLAFIFIFTAPIVAAWLTSFQPKRTNSEIVREFMVARLRGNVRRAYSQADRRKRERERLSGRIGYELINGFGTSIA